MLNVKSAGYYVEVIKREKRACRLCEEQGVAMAPLPPRIIEKSLVSDQVIICNPRSDAHSRSPQPYRGCTASQRAATTPFYFVEGTYYSGLVHSEKISSAPQHAASEGLGEWTRRRDASQLVHRRPHESDGKDTPVSFEGAIMKLLTDGQVESYECDRPAGAIDCNLLPGDDSTSGVVNPHHSRNAVFPCHDCAMRVGASHFHHQASGGEKERSPAWIGRRRDENLTGFEVRANWLHD